MIQVYVKVDSLSCDSPSLADASLLVSSQLDDLPPLRYPAVSMCSSTRVARIADMVNHHFRLPVQRIVSSRIDVSASV